jgi:hypothetical protein
MSLIGHRQQDTENGSLFQPGLKSQHASMPLNDARRDRKTEAGAGLFGGEKRIKEPLVQLRGIPAPVSSTSIKTQGWRLFWITAAPAQTRSVTVPASKEYQIPRCRTPRRIETTRQGSQPPATRNCPSRRSSSGRPSARGFYRVSIPCRAAFRLGGCRSGHPQRCNPSLDRAVVSGQSILPPVATLFHDGMAGRQAQGRS